MFTRRDALRLAAAAAAGAPAAIPIAATVGAGPVPGAPVSAAAPDRTAKQTTMITAKDPVGVLPPTFERTTSRAPCGRSC